MPGPAVTIATHGFPVRAVDSGAPELTLKESGGAPIVISDRGAPFVVDGYNPEPGEPPLPTNLVTNSQAFNLWSATGATVDANVANDPVNGAAVADRMTEAAGLQQHNLTYGSVGFTNAEYYTFSVWAKSEGGSSQFIQLLFGSAAFGANAWCNFDIVNGTVETKGSAAVGKVTSWGDGWFRCSMTAPATSTASAPVALFAANAANMSRALSYTGSTANTRLLFGAQVEAGKAANTYVST